MTPEDIKEFETEAHRIVEIGAQVATAFVHFQSIFAMPAGYIARQKEMRNLAVKQATMDLTYNESQRLIGKE